MKKPFRLYNVLFPIWMFWFPPVAFSLVQYSWGFRLIVLAVLAGNFAIDSLLLCLAMRHQGLENRGQIWKRSIWKIWGIGFLCDVIGAMLIFGLYYLLTEVLRVSWNLILFPGTTLISLPGVVLAGALIYLLNRRFAFTKCGLDPAQVHKLCLALAVFTAPYTMMIPIYG